MALKYRDGVLGLMGLLGVHKWMEANQRSLNYSRIVINVRLWERIISQCSFTVRQLLTVRVSYPHAEDVSDYIQDRGDF